MTTPLLDPGAAPAAPPAPPRHAAPSDRFFSWTAGLGVVRGDGWLGGVAAGLAARMRVDPLIVRGILVVAALFGFPVLFLYAVAWALLPDLDGRIPLQDALRGQFTSAQAGIAVCALLGLVPGPLTVFFGLPTLWSIAGVGGSITALSILFFLVGIAAVGALLFLIVRAAHRTPGTPASELRLASAAQATPEASTEESDSGSLSPVDEKGVDAAGFAASTPSDLVDAPPSAGAVAAPAAPPADAAAAEMAAWREQHAAWKVQDDAWRREQQDIARVAREQARRERQERGAVFAAEAAERRRVRRLTKPRTPFAYIAVAVGVAVIGGTLIALQHGGALAPALGLFTAGLVLAVAMVVAGAVRRRSGFLAFVTVVTLVGGAVAVAVPTTQALHVGSYGISNLGSGPDYPATAPFTQPWGNLTVFLGDTGRTAAPIHVDKGDGSTMISIEPGVALELDLTAPWWGVTALASDGEMIDLESIPDAQTTTLRDGRMRYRAILTADDGPITTEQKLVLDQQSGWIGIEFLPRATTSGASE